MPFTGPLGNRIAYDRDGSVLLLRKSARFGGGWINVHPTAVRALNGSNGGGMVIPLGTTANLWKDNRASEGESQSDRLALIFPEPMLLSGIYIQTLYRSFPNSFGARVNWFSVVADIRASQNTTNGEDGDWEVVAEEFQSRPLSQVDDPWPSAIGVRADTGANFTSSQIEIKGDYRHAKPFAGVGAQAVNLRNIRGLTIDIPIRSGITSSFDGDWINFFFHLYGHPDTISTGRVLAVWHPTLDIRVPGGYLPWSDDIRPSSATKTFRVKNLASQTANSILVAASDEYLAPAPSPASQIQFSLDGSTWASTVTIGSVSPGGASGVIYMRRTTPADSPLGSHSVRVDLTVGSWS